MKKIFSISFLFLFTGLVAHAQLTITAKVCGDASSVRLTGPWWSWNPSGGPMFDDNGDGTWTITLDSTPTDNMEYKLVVDGIMEDLVSGGDFSCTTVTDNATYANRQWTVGSGNVSGITFGTCGSSCDGIVIKGCMDVKASNYNADATSQAEDQYGNQLCAYTSCDDVPGAVGCMYSDSFGPYAEGFGAAECANYGGVACLESILTTEDFDSYNTGEFLGLESDGLWTTWENLPGSSQDAIISDEIAFSAPNAIKIQQIHPDTMDVVLDFGDFTRGNHDLSFWMYIKEGHGAYFNLLHMFDSWNSVWASDFFFSSNGQGLFLKHGCDIDDEELITTTCSADSLYFNYPLASWFKVNININIDDELATFSLNEDEIISWAWAKYSFGTNLGQSDWGFSGVNFYPFDDEVLYYIDDITFSSTVIACPSPNYFEYDSNYTHGDISLCRTLIVEGCTNPLADNYDWRANLDDGSCIITACPYQQYFEYDSNYTHADVSMCQTYIIEGCTHSEADNYNTQANKDDGSCIVEGCMNPSADNYNSMATYEDENTCLIYGCTNSNAENYQPEANFDDGTCIIGGCTLIDFMNYNSAATYDDGSCDPNSAHIYGCTDSSAVNYSLEATQDNGTCEWLSETESFEMHMPEGWSMFGYTCWESIGVEDAFAGMEDKIVIVKDGDGNPYLPEYGYNGLGNLKYARGYQLKLTEEVHGFSFCGVEGGNHSRTYEIGDLAHGGIVFYLDETGQHGLVAAMEDLTEGATDPYGWGYNGYEWSCDGESVNGADGQAIGTGYQNTLDIVNQGCSTENGGITAAQAALDAEIKSYSDWYLPSKDELIEMYNQIGDGGPEGNIGGFVDDWYWSSSEGNNYYAWLVNFNNGDSGNVYKDNTYRVRVIRAF